MSENIEASIALAQAALAKVQPDGEANQNAIETFRSSYYAATELGAKKK